MKKDDLRIVFMGTPDFAVESLKALIENEFNVVGVVTVPDKPAGRGQKLRMSAVKQYALQHNLPVLQPEKLKSKSFLNELADLNANLQVVVAFRILPEVVYSMPALGSFNLHGSLLPQYRGAAPINWAVINGETVTGVTTFFLKKKVDTGQIIGKKELQILEHDTAGTVHDKLMKIGAELVVETCESILTGNVNAVEQVVEEGTILHPAPKIFREDCEIDFNQNTHIVYNFIRGLSPYPAAWTVLNGKNFKLFTVKKRIELHDYKPGEINTDDKTFLSFATKDGWIDCVEVQLQGKRKMTITEFLNGYSINK